jgi:hypothetical protein
MSSYPRKPLAFALAASLSILAGCNDTTGKPAEGSLTVPDARASAKDAFIFGL